MVRDCRSYRKFKSNINSLVHSCSGEAVCREISRFLFCIQSPIPIDAKTVPDLSGFERNFIFFISVNLSSNACIIEKGFVSLQTDSVRCWVRGNIAK